MIRWIAIIEPLICLIGGAVGLWVGVKGIWIAHSEKKPTRFSVSALVDGHRGQQWLTIQGHVPRDMVFIQFGKTNADAPRPTYKVWIPVVPANWQPADPVHVLVCRVCVSDHEAKSWSAKFQNDPPMTHSFSGMLAPFGGPRDHQGMFPRLTFRKPLFFVNEGNEPNSPIGMYLIAGVCLVLLAVGCRRAYRVVRAS